MTIEKEKCQWNFIWDLKDSITSSIFSALFAREKNKTFFLFYFRWIIIIAHYLFSGGLVILSSPLFRIFIEKLTTKWWFQFQQQSNTWCFPEHISSIAFYVSWMNSTFSTFLFILLCDSFFIQFDKVFCSFCLRWVVPWTEFDVIFWFAWPWSTPYVNKWL